MSLNTNTMRDLASDLEPLDEFERGEAIYDGTWHADGRLNGMFHKTLNVRCTIGHHIFYGTDQDADAVY